MSKRTIDKRLCPECGNIYEVYRDKRHGICAGCEIALANDPHTAYGRGCPQKAWAIHRRRKSAE